MRLPVPIPILLVLLVAGAPALADWTASGVAHYRDREFGPTGFTGFQPLVPIRSADVQILDAVTLEILAAGTTDNDGYFSILVPDDQTRDVQVRILTRSDETADLHLEVTTAAFVPYAIAGPASAAHAPNVDLDFGLLTAEIGQGGEPFNIWDAGLVGTDYVAFLDGSRPGAQDSLVIVWEPARGQLASTASASRIDVRDTSGYDDTVILHEYGHFAVYNYSDQDNPGGPHGFAQCDQNPRLSWEEGHASFFGCSARRHFGLLWPNIYLRTTGAPGAGHVSLLADLETETQYECDGSTSEVAVFTALWDVFDGPAVQDFTPGVDDTEVDLLDLPDADHWDAMTNGLPGRSRITAEDYWDAWFEAPVVNGNLLEMISIFGTGVGIEYFEDLHEPNDSLGTAAAAPADGSLIHATFFKDPGGDGSGEGVDDEDWFSFPTLQGVDYTVETVNLWSAADTRIRITDGGGGTQANNDDRAAGDPSSFLTWTAPSDGTFFVEVVQPNDFTPYGSYDLRIYQTNDIDADGVPNGTDVCPETPDPGQEDADADSIGDACDGCPNDPANDVDADGVCADSDNCPLEANGGQEDTDGDTQGDACDVCPFDPNDDADLDGVCADSLIGDVDLLGGARITETVMVEFGSSMKYLSNSSDPGIGTAWIESSFDDSAWPAGAFGVGYEADSGSENLLTTIVPVDSRSVYARATFDIADVAAVDNLWTAADYDDGWIAWVNGVEVYRSPQMPAGVPLWDTSASSHESSNGLVPDYGPMIDISATGIPALQNGTNVLAIGIWNRNSVETTDLVLVPRLVVNRMTPVRYLANYADPGLGATWVQQAFDDSSWSTGGYGIGFENFTGAEALIRTDVPTGAYSIYTRADFELVNTTLISKILVGGDYDDAFVVWINGVEVRRSPEMPAGPPDWNTVVGSHESSNGQFPAFEPYFNVSPTALPVLQSGTNTVAVGVWNETPVSTDLVLWPSIVTDGYPGDNCATVANPLQEDADNDAVGDACDNCVFAPNTSQQDLDGDGAGDACDVCPGDPDDDVDGDGVCGDVDNCPQDFDATQADGDGDGRGDVCDNCVATFNPSQSDRDLDDEGDRCDADDGMIYILFNDPAWIEWHAETGFTEWNAYRGDLDLLRSGGPYTQDTATVPLAAQTCSTVVTSASDTVVLAAGQAVFFLTTGVAGAVETDLGADSNGVIRPNDHACP